MPSDVRPSYRSAETLNDWIVGALPDGLWLLDDEGRTTFTNARMAEMLGLEPDQMAGRAIEDSMDEVTRSQFAEHLAEIARHPYDRAGLRCCLTGADGREVWVLVTSTRMPEESGRFRGWMHRFLDGSQAAAFERRERQFTESQRMAGIGSWDWDFIQDKVTWSDELYDVYGVDPTFEPTIGSFLDRVHPHDRATVVAAIGGNDTGDTTFSFDYRYLREGGKATWIRSQGMVWRDATGKVTRMGGTSQDVSATKEIENAMAFLSMMGRAANESHTLAEVLAAADELVRPFAQWPGVVIGVPETPGSDRLHHLDVDWEEVSDEQRVLGRALADQAAAQRRIVQAPGPGGIVLLAGPVAAGGRLACVLVADTRSTLRPSAADLDLFEQILSLLRHVAEREWAAEELAAARDEALSASLAKSEFLATMSHEIRTPLNGVIGLSELLSSTDLTPHQRRLTSGVDQAGRTLLAVVNDILDLSKIEAGRLELEEVDFDPRIIIEQSAALVADQAREKHLELVVSSAASMPEQVRGDPVRFGQVISNLASNAVKFTSQGEVVIRATGEVSPTGVHLRVEVSDTGVGIAAEVQGRLFQAFSQADSSTTREYGGTGLGLAISRRIVSAMEGEIGVDSRVGSGSTFWFTVDLAPPLLAGPGPDRVREEAVAGLRVLVVDDNATNRYVLAERLAAWDVSTTTVASAVDALIELDAAAERGAAYDVALLDYMMPTVDGEQLSRMIRASSHRDGTRLALLSSALEPSREFLAAAGIEAFLSKPVLPAALLDTIAALGGRLTTDLHPVARPVDTVADGRRGRVLVVEDNPVNQLVAEGVLRRLGYSVLMADNGAVGVAAFGADSQGFDAILMDCQMPVMNGYDATHAIRAMQSIGRRIPIIAMTAGAAPEERQRCLTAGMDDFLLKPVDRVVLEVTLDRWIDPSGERAWPPPPVVVESCPEPTAQLVLDLVPDLVPDLVLDRGRLTELLETGSADLPLLHRIVDRFGTRALDAATELRAATSAVDAMEVARVAHSLRGAAGNVGLVRLARSCERIELAAEAGVLPGPVVLEAVATESLEGVTQLQRLLREIVDSAPVEAQPFPGPFPGPFDGPFDGPLDGPVVDARATSSG
ncbi:MAG: hypothetical protein JWN22_2622 [Nocardioides sp.]|nr:hypothetical protein [Nocardioides sp.]